MRPIDRLSRSFTRSTQTALLSCCRPDRCTFSDLRPIIVGGRDTTSQSRATTDGQQTAPQADKSSFARQ